MYQIAQCLVCGRLFLFSPTTEFNLTCGRAACNKVWSDKCGEAIAGVLGKDVMSEEEASKICHDVLERGHGQDPDTPAIVEGGK